MSRPPRSLFEELLELAVYVPAGIAAKALEQVPELAEAGRRRVGSQIDQARVIGRFAVGLARSRARRSFGPPARPPRPSAAHREPGTTTDRAEPAPGRPPGTPPPTGTTDRTPAGEPPHAPHTPTAGPTAPGRATGRPAPRRTAGPARRPAGSAPVGERPPPPQAIPDYDALAASQVVPRLQGLDREELAAVERYEAATRARRTILNRVAQLQRALDGE